MPGCRRVALTGGIATGKSHVRARIASHGVSTIDADVIAREVVAPGTPGLAAVVARFGQAVLDETGALDRVRLAAIVFDDAAARRALEAIVHPAVRQAIDAWFATLTCTAMPFAVADIPLLYEAGREQDFEVVIVTACAPEEQVRRLMARNGLTDAAARQRIAAQLPTEEKARRADFVIRTDGTPEDTHRQVDAVVASLAGR